MANLVCAGAICKCSFGAAPSALMVTPENRTMASVLPIAVIMDNVPLKNILPFGMCSNPANPVVASATAAAMGVLTPMPCIPVTPAPWVQGKPTVLVGNKPILTDQDKLMCAYGGVIEIANSGAVGITTTV